MFDAGTSGFNCLVIIRRNEKPWWKVDLNGTCIQVTAALDELAARIASDAFTISNASAGTAATVGAEAYWPDMHPLHFWEAKLPIHAVPDDLRVQARQIRQFVEVGHYEPLTYIARGAITSLGIPAPRRNRRKAV